MSNRQIPTEFFGDETPMFRRPAENFMQALMEAPAGDSPEESADELEPMRSVVAEAVEMLDDEAKWVINAVYSEQLSLQQIGDQLGVSKTHVFRIRNRALAKMRLLLQTNGIIRKRVKMADTWEEASEEIVYMLSKYTDDPTLGYSPLNIDHTKKMRDRLFKDDLERLSVWDSIAHEAVTELRKEMVWSPRGMSDLLVKKQRDYGHQNILQGGLFGVAIRLSDKIERYANLMNQDTPENESVYDTLADMVGYVVIAHMLIEGSFTLELAS